MFAQTTSSAFSAVDETQYSLFFPFSNFDNIIILSLHAFWVFAFREGEKVPFYSEIPDKLTQNTPALLEQGGMKLIISLLQNKLVYNGISLHKRRMLKAIFGEWKQHKFLQQITVLEETYNLSFLLNMFLNRDYFHACYRTQVILLEIILFIVLCIKIRLYVHFTNSI